MKLVPYILTQKELEHFTITRIALFLSHGGKSIWKADTPTSTLLTKKEILDEYCIPNGFVVDSISIDAQNKIAYIQVNKEKTNLSEFYTWDEAYVHAGKPECWRHFYFVKDKEGADWWSPKGLIEAEIQDFGNVHDLFLQISSWSKDIKL
jgi:hypothetical protein